MFSSSLYIKETNCAICWIVYYIFTYILVYFVVFILPYLFFALLYVELVIGPLPMNFFRILLFHVYAWISKGHVQNLYNTIFIWRTRYVEQQRSISRFDLFFHILTTISQCQMSEKSLASFWVHCLSQMMNHLNL